MWESRESRYYIDKDNQELFVKTFIDSDGKQRLKLLDGLDGMEKFLPVYLKGENEKTYILREYETEYNSILLEDLGRYCSEAIFGDWQPYDGKEKKLAVVLDASGFVSYEIRGRSGFGCYDSIYSLYDNNCVFRNSLNSNEFKKMLQHKIFINDQLNNSDSQFAAVLRGIENEDVTTYICSHFGNEGLNKLEDKGVYLRFPHSGDGYWEDYFVKLDDETFRTLEDGTILSKQEKFISDLGLTNKTEGFAIVPFKYNGHYVTLVADCSINPKTINMFDSSLYNVVSDGEKSAAFRDFLLGNPTALSNNEINGYKSLLNTLTIIPGSLQGVKLEDGSGKEMIEPPDKVGCYEMGTCGFWTLAFCIEAARCKSFEELQNKCQNKELFIKTAKRMSAIIDSQDSITEEQLINYGILVNSICIPSYLGLNQGSNNDYCDRLKQMLIDVGSKITIGTGHTTTISTEQELDNSTHNSNDLPLPHHFSSSPSLKQPIPETTPQKRKAKECEDLYYWRNKFKNNSAKHSSSKGHSIFD